MSGTMSVMMSVDDVRNGSGTREGVRGTGGPTEAARSRVGIAPEGITAAAGAAVACLSRSPFAARHRERHVSPGAPSGPSPSPPPATGAPSLPLPLPSPLPSLPRLSRARAGSPHDPAPPPEVSRDLGCPPCRLPRPVVSKPLGVHRGPPHPVDAAAVPTLALKRSLPGGAAARPHPRGSPPPPPTAGGLAQGQGGEREGNAG